MHLRRVASDWRWGPKGALARGEETGIAATQLQSTECPGLRPRRRPALMGRMRKRPEEPTSVAESPILQAFWHSVRILLPDRHLNLLDPIFRVGMGAEELRRLVSLRALLQNF